MNEHIGNRDLTSGDVCSRIRVESLRVGRESTGNRARDVDELMLVESRRRKQSEHPLGYAAKKRTEAPTASE